MGPKQDEGESIPYICCIVLLYLTISGLVATGCSRPNYIATVFCHQDFVRRSPTLLEIEFSTAMWNSDTWIFVKCMLIINIGITLTFSEMRSDAWSDLK